MVAPDAEKLIAPVTPVGTVKNRIGRRTAPLPLLIFAGTMSEAAPSPDTSI
jgi:hypothetical protein